MPVIDVYGGVDGRDLGGVLSDIQPLVEKSKKDLPRGSDIIVRGQAETMRSSYIGLGVGLVMAIVLIYFLLVVNFQSWLDPFIIITALPGALAGVIWGLFLTQTTLSVPALMGAIMSMGVATANSVLVVTFARENLHRGLDPDRRRAGSRRRPHPPGLDDGAGDDHRHVADEPRPGRRRRTKRAAGPRRDRRTGVRHRCHAVFCSRRFQLHAPASPAAAKQSSFKAMNSNPHLSPAPPPVRLRRIAEIVVVLVVIGLVIGLVPRWLARRKLAGGRRARIRSSTVSVISPTPSASRISARRCPPKSRRSSRPRSTRAPAAI